MNGKQRAISVETDDRSGSDAHRDPRGNPRGNMTKASICDRHWIFKKSKDCPQRKSLKPAPTPCRRSVSSFYTDHEKFLAHLRHAQKSLPYDNSVKVIDQTFSDSEDVKDLFSDAPGCRKSNFKLEDFMGTGNRNKELANSSPIGMGSSRSLRLNRRCKPSGFSFMDISDDEFDIGKSIFRKREAKSGSRTMTAIKGDHETNGDITMEEKSQSEKSNSQETEDSRNAEVPPKRKKKRKMELQGGGNIMNNIKNATKRVFGEKYSKLTLKNPLNGEQKANGLEKVVEIPDVENGVEVIPPSNTAEIPKEKLNCPMCNQLFSADAINDHAYTCQGPPTSTQTRSKKSSQENVGSNHNEDAWQSACKGLKKEESTAKVPAPELENPLANLKSSSRIINKMKLNDVMNSAAMLRPFSNTGYRIPRKKTVITDNIDLSKKSETNRSIVEDYAKTINAFSKKQLGKSVRNFDESYSEENEKVTCMRCGQLFSDDELKSHTDSCLDRTSFMEGN